MELYRRRTYGEWCASRNIAIGGTDTVTDKDCYSYRRESGKPGRMAFIWYSYRNGSIYIFLSIYRLYKT